jgi:hypothetical protein
MSENVHELFPQAEVSSSEQPAPILPVETHIVGAALAADQLRRTVEGISYMLRCTPRNAAMFDSLENDFWLAWTNLAENYRNYRHVLECKGQA